MPFVFSCPHCGTPHTVDERVAGRSVRCSRCDATIVVPAPDAAPPAEPPLPVVAPPQEPSAEEEDEEFELPRGKPLPEAEMDMTPMVDVTFQLLIFFMVTAAFALQKTIEIPKPKQDEATAQVQMVNPEEDPEYVTVYVDENNTYRVVTVDWDVEAPSAQELLRKLREARNTNSAGIVPTKLLVKAHGDALHEKVVAALDAGTEVGMDEVKLMTIEDTL